MPFSTHRLHGYPYVRPSSVRVAANALANLPNVAYQTPGDPRGLLALNTGSALQKFNRQCKGRVVGTALYGGSGATYIW